MNKENKKETVCAVVVTYNRKNLLLECLEAIRRQTRPVDGIYIIDNASDDGTPELLKENGYIPELPPFNILEPYEIEHKISNLVDGNPINVFYVRMHKNTGGAGGFYEGVKRGYERGYDWLWLMDDDAEPKEDALENLLLINAENILCLCPIIVNKKSGKVENYHHKKFNFLMWDKPISIETDADYYKNKVIDIEANAFVGPLIKRKTINLVGFPNPNLFIWGDDTDYTYRIHNKGRIVLVGSSIIIHKGDPISKVNQLWKTYYLFRNKILFLRSHSKYNFLAYLYLFYRAIISSLALLIKYRIFDTDKIILPLRGIKDGLKVRRA